MFDTLRHSTHQIHNVWHTTTLDTTATQCLTHYDTQRNRYLTFDTLRHSTQQIQNVWHITTIDTTYTQCLTHYDTRHNRYITFDTLRHSTQQIQNWYKFQLTASHGSPGNMRRSESSRSWRHWTQRGGRIGLSVVVDTGQLDLLSSRSFRSLTLFSSFTLLSSCRSSLDWSQSVFTSLLDCTDLRLDCLPV